MANPKLHQSVLSVLLCSALVFIVACTAERNPCLEPKLPFLYASCYQYKSDTKTYTDTALPNANFVSMDIDSAKRWYWGVNTLSKFSLVLSPLLDTTRWSLQADSAYSPIDTISFIYTRNLKFYTNACGYGYVYSLVQVLTTQHNLDSVKIANKEVTTKAGIENVKIYF
ncbi:MAG: DUF6452 family protein [Phycisphaerales bacterium]|nr:DUF6452 family protein [Phycisphaerales bacterium]